MSKLLSPFRMTAIFLLLAISSNLSTAQSLKGRTMVFHYAQYLDTDTLNHKYVWDEKIYNYAKEKSFQVIYKWTSDSTVNLISGKDKQVRCTFIACHLNAAEKKRVPASILDGKYKLAGVYEQSSERGSGAYDAIYVSDKNMLMLNYLNIVGFMEGALLFMPTPDNDLQKAGFRFPYIVQMEEEVDGFDSSTGKKNGKMKMTIRHSFTKH